MSSSQPLISLVLCVKNGMPYLTEAVESVRAQTYRIFELIVQDSASTDGSLEFLRGVEDIPNMQIESVLDGGIGPAYNRAVHRCKGDIIGSIDADNLLEKEALEVVVQRFAEHPGCAAIYGAKRFIDANGEHLDTGEKPAFDLSRVMRCDIVPPFATSFFSRQVCGDELRFDERLKTCGDYDLWLRIGHLPIVRVPNVLGSTRLSEKSMTCRPETYDQFCSDKIFALEQYLSRCECNPVMEAVRRESTAGIYLWAAKSIYALEGKSEAFLSFLQRAGELDPRGVKETMYLIEKIPEEIRKRDEKIRKRDEEIRKRDEEIRSRGEEFREQGEELRKLEGEIQRWRSAPFFSLIKYRYGPGVRTRFSAFFSRGISSDKE